VREDLTNNQHSGAYAFVSRMLSLLLAMGMAGVIFAYPKAFVHISHGILFVVFSLLCLHSLQILSRYCHAARAGMTSCSEILQAAAIALRPMRVK
jgi:hypothetical protein